MCPIPGCITMRPTTSPIPSTPRRRGSRAMWDVRGGSPRQRFMNCPSVRRSEEHTSELQSLRHLVCRLLLEKKNTTVGAAPDTDRKRQPPDSDHLGMSY